MIGETVGARLQSELEQLLIGVTQLSDYASGVQAWYMAGFVNGQHSRDDEVDRLKWERDLWYFLASNKGKSGADFYKQLTTELWTAASK